MKELTILYLLILIMSCSKTQNNTAPPTRPPIDTTPKPIVYKVIPLPVTGTNIFIKDAAELNYSPGDTLLVTQSVESLSLYNVIGTEEKPVILKSADAVIIGGSYNKSVDIIGKFMKIQGLHIVGKTTTVGLRAYYSSDLSFEDIDIDSASVGMLIKNDARATDSTTFYPSAVIRNISLKNCHVKNCNNEGFYIGNTSDYQNGQKNSPIIGLTVENCSAENIGWDGFQVTNAQNCNVKGITITNAGANFRYSQMSGIAIQDATSGSFENLSVNGCAGGGLTILGCGEFIVKNVVLNDVCKVDNTNGIFVDNRPDRGFNLGAKKLVMENIDIQGGNLRARYPLYILNGTLNGALPAIPGTITNLTYVSDLWPHKIKDDVGNEYIGGTEGK